MMRNTGQSIAVFSAGILAAAMVTVPPDAQSVRPASHPVQLSAFAPPSKTADRVALVQRLFANHAQVIETVPPESNSRTSKTSKTPPATVSPTMDAAAAATLGPTGLPILDAILLAGNPILGPVAAAGGWFVIFGLLIPAAFLNYAVLSLLSGGGILPILDALGGLLALPVAAPFAATLETDEAISPATDPQTGEASDMSVPSMESAATEDEDADVSGQSDSTQPADAEAGADEASVESTEAEEDTSAAAEDVEVQATSADDSEVAEAEKEMFAADVTEAEEEATDDSTHDDATENSSTDTTADAAEPADGSTSDSESSDAGSADGS